MAAPARSPVRLLVLLLGVLGLAPALLAPDLHGQVRKRGEEFATSRNQPEKSTRSRIRDSQLPTDAPTGDADALAARLGLEDTEPGPMGTRRWRHQKTGMLFVFIPGGVFPMGSRHSDAFMRQDITVGAGRAGLSEAQLRYELPIRDVYVSPYFAGVYEVTVAEYRQFLEDTDAEARERLRFPLWTRPYEVTPYLWDRPELGFWEDRCPVTGISWLAAWSFCEWMGGRLPTEAEWEKAARGTDERTFPWGDYFDPMRANTAESMNGRTTVVGTYLGGRSPYGCLDMAGNVYEYALDAFDPKQYDHGAAKDPCLLERFPPLPRRVMRGGSWGKNGQFPMARTTFRQPIDMDLDYAPAEDPLQYLHIGFRVVLSPYKDLYPEGFLDDFLQAR